VQHRHRPFSRRAPQASSDGRAAPAASLKDHTAFSRCLAGSRCGAATEHHAQRGLGLPGRSQALQEQLAVQHGRSLQVASPKAPNDRGRLVATPGDAAQEDLRGPAWRPTIRTRTPSYRENGTSHRARRIGDLWIKRGGKRVARQSRRLTCPSRRPHAARDGCQAERRSSSNAPGRRT